LRLRLLRQQAEAGDIVLLFADESEARESGFHFRRHSLGARPAQRAGLKSRS